MTVFHQVKNDYNIYLKWLFPNKLKINIEESKYISIEKKKLFDNLNMSMAYTYRTNYQLQNI